MTWRQMTWHRAAAPIGLALTLAASAGCSGDGDRTRLTVLAASSLTDAFTDLEATYESSHPDIDVALSFDSSSTLAAQVVAGAPADVIATADETTMAVVADQDLLAGPPVEFARNTLVLVTPSDNPAGFAGVRDLERSDVQLAVCVPEAPCGQATARLLELDGIEASPVTFEDNVRSVLTKVRIGQVDAGIVYVSDAQAAGDAVTTISIPNSSQVVNVDPIGVIAGSDNPDAAQDWVDLVLSDAGQQTLASYGFQTVS